MSFVDGFVVAVPADKKDVYKAVAERMLPMFAEFGATRVVECWGSDVPDGTVTDFKRAVQAKPDEVVVFSWIEWPSKGVRDEGHRRMMSDPRMPTGPGAMPFDGKRMIIGGFDVLLDGGAQ